MEKLPIKRNLAQETAAVLKDWILQGTLYGDLPGELALKQRLCVSRDTLRRSLKQLAEEGWITSASRGKPRRIQIQQAPLPAKLATNPGILPVGFISPFRDGAMVTLMELDETSLRLASQGRRMLFFSPEIFHLSQPGRHLERLVQSTPVAAWILHATSEAVQRWFDQSGLPAFLYEMPFPGVNLPYVASDWGAAAYHAGVQFVRQGHRVIGILEYMERRPGLVADEQGLQRALSSASPEAQMLVFKDDLSVGSVVRSLEAAFRLVPRPTALVLTRVSQVATCYSWLASQGIRVPKDVSLVSLPNDTWFAHIHPPLCYYTPDTGFMSRKIAERVLELVETGCVTHKSVLCPLNFVSGGSIGQVP